MQRKTMARASTIRAQAALDELACNFNPQATIANNESCAYPGCQDPSASNYDCITAGCAGECVYLAYDCCIRRRCRMVR